MYRLLKRFAVPCVLVCLAAVSHAGEIVDGVLTVDGKPFFPVGTWGGSPEYAYGMGMNAVLVGAARTPESIPHQRQTARQFGKYGLQIIPYLSYGGPETEPWTREEIGYASAVASEGNVLAWYIGDDITEVMLDGVTQTSTNLRAVTPRMPIVADYIPGSSPECAAAFARYLDIRCQYSYPIPGVPLREYADFFDEQRALVGDPLWTWVQCFQWEHHGELLHLGRESSGPIPDPAQLRLMSYIGINRGLRGLYFFPQRALPPRPELAAEVELVCREARLFNDLLAAGSRTYDLAVSDTSVLATAMRYDGSTLLSTVVMKPYYSRWVDDGVVRNVKIVCPWDATISSGELPDAHLVSVPEMISCRVEPGPREGTVEVTIPELELGGFVFVSNDEQELSRLRSAVRAIPDSLERNMLLATAAQLEDVKRVAWAAGWDWLGAQMPEVKSALRGLDSCALATMDGRYADAFLQWRQTLRTGRVVVDRVMQDLETKREVIPTEQQKYLMSPHSIRLIDALPDIPSPDDPWHYIAPWQVVGPFQLEWDGTWAPDTEHSRRPTRPPGFDRPYPPEQQPGGAGPYATLDGESGWIDASADASGRLDLLPRFATSDDVVSYARTVVVAPRRIETTLSVGSNDGFKAWVNGGEVLDGNYGRGADPHQDQVAITLREGRNDLLFKVSNLGANWQLYVALHDPDRELRFERP